MVKSFFIYISRIGFDVIDCCNNYFIKFCVSIWKSIKVFVDYVFMVSYYYYYNYFLMINVLR